MKEAAKKLDFELAIEIRDKIKEIRKKLIERGIQTSAAPGTKKRKKKAGRR